MNNLSSNKAAAMSNEMKIDSSMTVDRMRLSIYNDVVKKLFFICEICDGALVPISTCVLCKKTISRKCVGCGIKVSTLHTVSQSELRCDHDLTEVKLQ